MPVQLPPPKPPAGAKGSQWQQFVNYWSAHGYPALKQNAQAILLAAKAQNIDPVTFGALVLNESGANFKTKDSSTGAVGIGQLLPSTFIGPNAFNGGVLPWDSTHKITTADLRNPAVNLRLSAAYFGYLQGQYPADAYGRYNVGPNGDPAAIGASQTAFQAKWITKWNPKYVPQTTTTGPPSAAGPQVPGGTAPQTPDIKDPWIVRTDKGAGFKFVNAPSPPPGTVLYGGQPITRSQYNQIWNQTYSDTFFAYTGRHANAGEITNILARAPSIYSLSNELAAKPTFDKSPVWKQHAPGLVEYARTILGNNWKPSGGIIRQAIAQNWDQATFTAHLRKLPAFQNGPQFKTDLAQNTAAFEAIYGKASADPALQESLKQKTLAGWTPQELQAWLRDQPAYTHSSEYQAKQTSLLSQLGLITGAVPTLSGQQVDEMLNANPFPSMSPGAAATRPDNRAGPLGANPGGVSPPTYPPPRVAVRPQTKTPSSGR